MELNDALLKRRSVRKYQEKQVADDVIDRILQAAMSGPSACNKKPWEFYVIKNNKICRLLENNDYLHSFYSPVKIVVCGNLNNALDSEGKDYWIQDCSAAIENILLKVTDEGLGACWCGIYPIKARINYFKNVLNLEQNIVPLGLITLGYPDESVLLEPRTQFETTKIHIVE